MGSTGNRVLKQELFHCASEVADRLTEPYSSVDFTTGLLIPIISVCWCCLQITGVCGLSMLNEMVTETGAKLSFHDLIVVKNN